MNWFENWFNSKYYHILYKNRDHKEGSFFSLITRIKNINLIMVKYNRSLHVEKEDMQNI